MFDVSFGELLVAAIVALLVIGPKDLPDAVRKAGQYWWQVKRLLTDARSQWNDVLQQSGAANVQHDMETIHKAMEPVHRALAHVKEQPLEVFLEASAPAPAPSVLASPVSVTPQPESAASPATKTNKVKAKSAPKRVTTKAAPASKKRIKRAPSHD